MKHENSGDCQKCEQIFNKYAGFNQDLKSWFKELQKNHPEAHISCAGRGKFDQQQCFIFGTSKARYGESSHNYNCAIDVFVLQESGELYDREWFHNIIAPNIKQFLKWYGAPDSVFKELPHIEVAEWKALREAKKVSLVEPAYDAH